MAKILQFRKALKHPPRQSPDTLDLTALADGVDDRISAIVYDSSLTAAQRRWLLENLLMDIDEQLATYQKELECAERKLERLVSAAEQQIQTAYDEYMSRVEELTESVKNLTEPVAHQRK